MAHVVILNYNDGLNYIIIIIITIVNFNSILSGTRLSESSWCFGWGRVEGGKLEFILFNKIDILIFCHNLKKNVKYS